MGEMYKPSVPKKASGGKVDERFFGTIGGRSTNVSPSSIAGGNSHPSQSVKARSFGTHPDNTVGENESNISQADANATRTAPGMPKRVNDSPGAMKRGKA